MEKNKTQKIETKKEPKRFQQQFFPRFSPKSLIQRGLSSLWSLILFRDRFGAFAAINTRLSIISSAIGAPNSAMKGVLETQRVETGQNDPSNK